MATIKISGMKFYANHGCFSEEQAIGTHFSVDAVFECNTAVAQKSDNIADTVDYLAVYQVIKAEMSTPSHLLEHVADRIGVALLNNFEAINQLSITVYKLNPPLGGQINSVSVTVDMAR